MAFLVHARGRWTKCPWGLSAAAVLSLAWPLYTELEALLTEPSQLLCTEAQVRNGRSDVLFAHPRLQPAEEPSWKLSSILALWQKDHRFKRRVTQRDPVCLGGREADKEGGRQGREGRKREKTREGERKKGLSTQEQILKWAALWFRVRPSL